METRPAWASNYVGIPYRDRGRDRDGVDCWGLVRLVYADRFGVILPDYLGDYVTAENSTEIAPIVAVEAASKRWAQAGAPRVGDVGVFRILGAEGHVGVYVGDSRMIHSLAGVGSVEERVDSPLWIPRLAGWYRYAGPVIVKTSRSIFAGQIQTAEVEEGASIVEMIIGGGLDPQTPGLRVYVGDAEVPREHWPMVRPRAGRRVTVGVVPAGGGGGAKTALRVVLTLAVVVAAIYLAPALAGAFVAGAASATQVAVATAAIGLAGTLAINALIPPPSASLSAGDSVISPTISGAGNEIRAYAAVPVVLGRHRITPPYGARPYTETVGSDQYLRCLFVAGYGPLDLSDFRIGETSIDEFDGVEIEVRNGYAGDEAHRLYPSSVFEDSLSVLLKAVDGWTVRTSRQGATEISVDITFPTGVAEVGSDGSRSTIAVGVEVEYSPTGLGAWVGVNYTAPGDVRAMDVLFRTPDVEQVGTGSATGRVAWSASGAFPDSPPDFVPSSGRFSIECRGWVKIEDAGEYRFGVDASGPVDLTIAGRSVVEWYGLHATTGGGGVPDFDPHSGEITLARGNYPFVLRFEARDAAAASLAFGWRKPGGSWEIVPAESIFASTIGQNGPDYAYRLFETSAYGSSITVEDATTDQVRRTLSWAVPSGQYDVRVRRVTPDTDSDSILDESYWTALRTITPANPIGLAGLATIALRIKATDQLNGVVDSFNVLAESIVPDYDAAAGAWVDRATQNPASLFRAVLQHRANRRRVADARLDLSTLAAWHTECEAKGFTFNAVYDFGGTVFERLSQVASMGRASFAMSDGRFSVVRDRPGLSPVQIFTPRNSRGFRGRRSFPDVPHALRVRFLNSEAGYQQDERTVYADDYDVTTATEFESIELFGCTDAALAWRVGRYFLAVAALRPETYEIDVDAEHLVCRRGDVVLVNHDAPLLGTHSGRVHQLVEDTSGRLAVVVVDAPVEMEAGKSYAIKFRTSAGEIISAGVRTDAGQRADVYLDPPLPIESSRPAIGDLFAFGERTIETRECVIKSITMGTDLSATLVLVDYAPAVHEADVGDIPPYEPGINSPPSYDAGPYAPIIDSIQSDDFVMIRDSAGVLRPRIVVRLRRVLGSARPAPHSIQARIREIISPSSRGSWSYRPVSPADAGSVDFVEVEAGRLYEVAVRYISAAGAYSAWTSADHEVVGHTRPPPDVVSFDVVRIADGTRRFSWVLGDIPPDVVGVRIKYAPAGVLVDWAAMSDLAANGGYFEGASPLDLAAPGAGEWRFGIKMVDAGGLESVNAIYVERSLGPLPADNVAVLVDGRSEGWPGEKTFCAIGNAGELFALSQSTWATLPATWADWSTWSFNPWPAIFYVHPTIDAGFLFEFEPAAIAVVDVEQVAEILFDHSEDGENWAGALNIRLYEGRTVRARFVRFACRVDASSSRPVATLYDLTLILKAPTVEEVIDNLATNLAASGYRIGVGHIFAPISSAMFAAIRSVSVSFNGSGAGWTYEIVNKAIDPGPELKIYNAAHEPADATIDIIVRGIGSADGSTTPARFGVLRFNQGSNAVLLGVV